MLQEIFNKANYSFNPYAVPEIVIATYSLLLGIFVLVKKKWEGISLFLTASSISMWLFTVALMYLSAAASTAYLWTKICYFLGVCFISINTYFFSLVVTKRINDKGERKLLYFGYFVMAVFAFFSISTDLFVKYPPHKFPWGYYPNAAFLFHIFLPLWTFFVIKTTYNFYTSYRKENNALEKKRYKIFFYSYLLGYIASSDFFAVYGIEVYTFGYIFVCIWVTLFVYNFIKYKAFGIDTVIHRTFLWLATSLWLVMPAYFLFKYTRRWLETLSTLWLTIAALVLFYLFLWYYRYFQPRIDHLFRRRKYDYQAILVKIAEKISTTINIKDLTEQLLNETCEVMYLRNGSLFLLNKEETKYALIGRCRHNKVEFFNEAKETITCLLFKWLSESREVLEKEQIELDPKFKVIKQEALELLNKQELEIIVPIVLENKVNAILGLGKKENLKDFTLKDIELLKKLGQEAGVTIYNALHYRDLLEKDRMEEEMRLGRDIQMNLLPKGLPDIPGLNISGLMLPAKEIGGDYYDFISLPRQDELAIAIADVSGKGVAAGIIMATAKATLKGLSQQNLSPKQILAQTNSLIYEYTNGQKFITMLYFHYKQKDKTIVYSSAGHEHILIYRTKSDIVESIISGGFMLGMLEDIDSYLEEHSITLGLGDKILLYTDGVTEAENEKGERFGLKRLTESFAANSRKQTTELIQSIKEEVYAFSGRHPQYDDITLVAMEKK